MRSTSLSIQPFADADRAALLDLWRRCDLAGPDVERSIDFARKHAHVAILVGKADGLLVASVMVGHDGHAGFLYFVAVDPAQRGKGLGRAVVTEAEAWLAARGIWRTMLMVRQDNTQVVSFYEHLGWAQATHVVMQKRLLP